MAEYGIIAVIIYFTIFFLCWIGSWAAIERGVDLAELPAETLHGFHPALGEAARAVLTLESSLAARRSAGGTAPERVREAIAAHRARLG